jgi:phosphatidylglycerophosphate synthase
MGTPHPDSPQVTGPLLGPVFRTSLDPGINPGLDSALRRSARANGLVGLALTLLLGLGLVAGLGLGWAYILMALAAYGLILLILSRFLPLHRPRSRLGPANQVTLGRGVLTALVIALSGEAVGIAGGINMGIGMGAGVGIEMGTCVGTCMGTGVVTGVATGAALAWTALALALLATLLDGVDGQLARRLGWASPLGARFDMEVDALLIAGLALLLWTLDRAGAWVLAAGALRYLFVAAGAFWPWLGRPLPPSKRRQTVCVIQILTLILALVPLLPRTWASLVAAIGLGFLVWSFALDIGWLARQSSQSSQVSQVSRGGLDSKDGQDGQDGQHGRHGQGDQGPTGGGLDARLEPLGIRGTLGLLAALALLNVALSFHARWPTLGVEWRWELSPEFALLVLVLGLVAATRGRPSLALDNLLAGLLTLLVLGRYFAVMASALYGRPVNLAADAAFLPDVLAMILASASWYGLLGLPLALLVLLGLVFAALRWALGRIIGALDASGPRRLLTLAAGAACAVYLVGAVSPGLAWEGGFARPLTLDLAGQIQRAAPLLTSKFPAAVAEKQAGAPEIPPLPTPTSTLTPTPIPTSTSTPMPTPTQAATTTPRVSPVVAPTVTETALDGVLGAQVIILFAEAYGAVTFDRPALAAALAPAREELAAALAATGRGVVSARVRSPTFAGVSKLAHASFLTGIEVRDYDAYSQLLDEQGETLVHRFARAGYRTLAVMPGLKYEGWPEATYYGFDAVLDAQALDYHGPDFGWWRIPDQFTLARLDATEFAKANGTGIATAASPGTGVGHSLGPGPGIVTATGTGTGAGRGADAGAGNLINPPRLIVLGNISTHAPFHPPPPYQPDWNRLLTVEPFGPVPPITDQEDEAPVRQALLADPAGAYARTFDYFLRVLAGWLRLRDDLDLVLLIIGDHQPLAAVSGEGANWEVPVHLITARPALREAFLAAGFVPGLDPGTQVLGGMADLNRTVRRAFDSTCDSANDSANDSGRHPGDIGPPGIDVTGARE